MDFPNIVKLEAKGDGDAQPPARFGGLRLCGWFCPACRFRAAAFDYAVKAHVRACKQIRSCKWNSSV